MKVLGVTGGVGMGKSTAAQLLRERGVPVVDTDELARQVVQPGEPALAEIQKQFGADVVGPDGQLRRDVLAKLVFADPAARKELEAITHPPIRRLWQAQVRQWRAEGIPVAAVIIPLLFETNAEAEFDAVVCVACTMATQRERLSKRGWSEQEIEQRIAAQMAVEQKLAKSNHVVWTEGDLESHEQQLQRILGGAVQ